MAKLNYSESGPLASGKIGGQQIIKNRHGVILQSISQPPSFGTVEQKKQRFVTNTLAQKWKQLTASQQQSFADSATTWFKKSKSGQLINQTPYGLFLFLQQNSALIGEDGPLFGVDYQSLIEPQAYLVSKSQTSIIVKSDNTVNDYEYLVFIDPRTTDFRVSQLNSELLVGRLTALELGNGIDVATMIQSHYDFPVNMSKVSTRISAVEMGTGRRSEDIRWLYQLPETTFVSGIFISPQFTGIAMSQNGDILLAKRHNAFIRTLDLTPSWQFDVYTQRATYSGLVANSANLVFSNDGLNLYVASSNVNPAIIYHYVLTIPYNVTTRTLNATYPITTIQGWQTLYLSYDGSILIVSNLSGTYKLQMSTPFDLSTASQIDMSTTYKALNKESIFFSTDGLTFFKWDTAVITQYKLLTPFDISDLTANEVKNLNASILGNMESVNFPSIFMDYSGNYFALGIYSFNSNYNNIALFKFGSPFNL